MKTSYLQSRTTFVNMSANFSSELKQQIFERVNVTAKLQIPILTLFGVMAVAGILLNSITLYIFITGRSSSWKSVRFFVASLAASDILFCIASPVLAAFYLTNTSVPNSRVFCGVWRLIHGSAFLISLLNTLAIAVERFVVIYYPASALSDGRVKRLIAIALIWCSGFAICFERVIVTKPEIHPFYNFRLCVFLPSLMKSNPNLYLVLYGVQYFLPIILILIFYALLAVKMHMRTGIVKEISSRSRQLMKRCRNQVSCIHLSLLCTEQVGSYNILLSIIHQHYLLSSLLLAGRYFKSS